MNNTATEVLSHLKPLVGLKLSIARRAHSMANFQFGNVKEVDRGTVGGIALPISCPWRIERADGIVTGSMDYWVPAEEVGIDFDYDAGAETMEGNLQDKHLQDLFGGYHEKTLSVTNDTDGFVVENIQADSYGGAVISLSGGYRLVLFPDGTRRENWRIFKSDSDEPHFVIAGGKVELSDE